MKVAVTLHVPRIRVSPTPSQDVFRRTVTLTRRQSPRPSAPTPTFCVQVDNEQDLTRPLEDYRALLAAGPPFPPLYVKIIVEVILIIVISVAFALFDSFWGMVLSGAFIILALLPLSFVVFRYGVWLNFDIPLVAVQLHQMAEGLKESRQHRARKPNHSVENPRARGRDTSDMREQAHG